jgi:hypothetical protein
MLIICLVLTAFCIHWFEEGRRSFFKYSPSLINSRFYVEHEGKVSIQNGYGEKWSLEDFEQKKMQWSLGDFQQKHMPRVEILGRDGFGQSVKLKDAKDFIDNYGYSAFKEEGIKKIYREEISKLILNNTLPVIVCSLAVIAFVLILGAPFFYSFFFKRLKNIRFYLSYLRKVFYWGFFSSSIVACFVLGNILFGILICVYLYLRNTKQPFIKINPYQWKIFYWVFFLWSLASVSFDATPARYIWGFKIVNRDARAFTEKIVPENCKNKSDVSSCFFDVFTKKWPHFSIYPHISRNVLLNMYVNQLSKEIKYKKSLHKLPKEKVFEGSVGNARMYSGNWKINNFIQKKELNFSHYFNFLNLWGDVFARPIIMIVEYEEEKRILGTFHYSLSFIRDTLNPDGFINSDNQKYIIPLKIRKEIQSEFCKTVNSTDRQRFPRCL